MSWGPLITAIAALVGATLCGAVGYACGHRNAPTAAQAEGERERAFARALTSARADAYSAAETRGLRDGLQSGRSKARLAGRGDGRDAADAAITEVRAAAAESTPTPSTDPYDYPLDSPAPQPTGTVCPPPFSYHMGVCRIARPALPEECPPGWVPAGVTGACGPAGRP